MMYLILLGLEDDEKGIHMSLVTENTWKNVKKGFRSKLRIDAANRNRIYSVAKQYWWQERTGILN